MSQTNVQIARRLYDAFGRGDLNAFGQAVSPTLVWNEAESSLNCAGNPYCGFAAVRDGVFAPTFRDFDDFRVDVERLIDAGDHVVGTGRYRDTHRKTGSELSAQFCHLLHIDEEGRLDSLQEYVDTLSEAQVAGHAKVLDPVRVEPAA